MQLRESSLVPAGARELDHIAPLFCCTTLMFAVSALTKLVYLDFDVSVRCAALNASADGVKSVSQILPVQKQI